MFCEFVSYSYEAEYYSYGFVGGVVGLRKMNSDKIMLFYVTKKARLMGLVRKLRFQAVKYYI